MSKRMISMGSIEQFRNVIHNVQKSAQYIGYDKETDETIVDRNVVLPKMSVIATEKIHGTNSGVSYSHPDGFWVQSRKNIITVEKDNAACAFNVSQNVDVWMDIINKLASHHDINLNENIITVFFEWAGGNIQKKSAVSGLEKLSFIFQHFKVSPIEQDLDANGKQSNAYWLETRVGTGIDAKWLDSFENKIYNVMNFTHWAFDIDFNAPGEVQNYMIKLVEEDIEPHSPLGQQLGIDDNVGEGIVVTFMFKDVLYKFKVKGNKHANSNVKVLKPVDTVKEQNKVDFANLVCTPIRLEQAWQETFGIDNEKLEPNIKATGDFLRAVIKDVWKEESDIAYGKSLEPKEVNSLISKVARVWFMSELDKMAGI